MKKVITLILILFVFSSTMVCARESVTISVNGVEMQTKGILKDDRTFVPLRFVAEGLGATVKWMESRNVVYIYGQQEKVIPVSEWFNEDFDKMMQVAFEDAGLDFNKVYRKTPFEYAYEDENVGLLTAAFMGTEGKLIIDFYGEGTLNNPSMAVSALWFFDIETHQYGKICENCVASGFYEDRRLSPLFTYSDYEGNVHFFDVHTSERWSIPNAKLIAAIGHTVYYVRDKLCVYNLDSGKEEVCDVELNRTDIYRSYTDGDRIYIKMLSLDENILVLDLTNLSISQCDYFDTEFDFWEKSILGVRGNDDLTKPPRIFVNDMPVYNIPDSFLLNDRTYVPLRFIAEEMGAEVVWVDGENRVEINDKPSENPWYTFTEGGSPDILVYN